MCVAAVQENKPLPGKDSPKPATAPPPKESPKAVAPKAAQSPVREVGLGIRSQINLGFMGN